jgi:ABC-type dipeptide/oligopeptide/nickel transport system ATPase component
VKETVLEVKNLNVWFKDEDGNKKQILKNVSFELYKNEILAFVGESGSGKSITCLSIMGLLGRNAIIEGNAYLYADGEKVDLISLPESEKRKYRGDRISMIFQEPSAVLNPLLTVGEQIVETILAHRVLPEEDAKNLAIKTMEKVRIPEPEKRFYQYPHELSGGLKQRVAIAIGIVNNPTVLLADEPTTALDVTVSAQILNLFTELKEKLNMGILLITHDFGVVAEIADRVIVIYKGQIVETGDVFEIFDNPKHEYTKKLLQSRLVLNL